jgi:hypothetical protein
MASEMKTHKYQVILVEFCIIRARWLAMNTLLDNVQILIDGLNGEATYTIKQPGGKSKEVDVGSLLDNIKLVPNQRRQIGLSSVPVTPFNNEVQGELRIRSMSSAFVEMQAVSEAYYLKGDNRLKRNGQNVFAFVQTVRNAIAHNGGEINPNRVKEEVHWRDWVLKPDMGKLYIGDVDMLEILEDIIGILKDEILKEGEQIYEETIRLAQDLLSQRDK